MKLYRFSPIHSEEELLKAVVYVHRACHRLCRDAFGRYLPVRGNVGVFAHYEDEFAYLTGLREQLTDAAVNYKGKYFELRQPIVVPPRGDIPGATYDYLYIRRVDPYRSQVGDVDFVLPVEDHATLKTALNTETFVNGARLFGRPEENIIELWNPDVDVAAYVADNYMRETIAGRMDV